jgi:hypothetical protein
VWLEIDLVSRPAVQSIGTVETGQLSATHVIGFGKKDARVFRSSVKMDWVAINRTIHATTQRKPIFTKKSGKPSKS